MELGPSSMMPTTTRRPIPRGDMMEVERKYLLSALPSREILGRGVEIRQGYIDAADPEIRVRQKGPASFPVGS